MSTTVWRRTIGITCWARIGAVCASSRRLASTAASAGGWSSGPLRCSSLTSRTQPSWPSSASLRRSLWKRGGTWSSQSPFATRTMRSVPNEVRHLAVTSGSETLYWVVVQCSSVSSRTSFRARTASSRAAALGWAGAARRALARRRPQTRSRGTCGFSSAVPLVSCRRQQPSCASACGSTRGTRGTACCRLRLCTICASLPPL
mmetsp:Transcript_62152/g.172268  ORF Transcript_62152/g.172268 Transcript_62152/m.172268 type:complete len:203 (-) Transcript_62152:82-690(-)